MKVLNSNSEGFNEAYSKLDKILNQQKLPYSIFKIDFLFKKVILFETLFEVEFQTELFCKLDLKKLLVLSLNPNPIEYKIQGYEVSVLDILDALHTNFISDSYIKGVYIDYYTSIERFVIFSKEVCIYADREHGVAIVASQKPVGISEGFFLSETEYLNTIKKNYYDVNLAQMFSSDLFHNYESY